MENKMCQQRKSTSKQTQTKYLYQQSSHSPGCHQCKMCSSFSATSSSSSSISSSSSSLSPLSFSKNTSRRSSFDKKNNGCFIQQHLQSMFYLLRREETLKMAVRLESAYSSRTRYLVVVSRIGKNQSEECCLLGIDCNKKTTVGLVLKVLADTAITLDGDGGFSVSVCGRQHIFKPVSVQAMWSALQTLYRVSTKARDCNYFEGGNSHDWVSYYEQSIESDRSCLNEWHTMNDIESRRPPSPDSLRSKPRERLETERVIRSTLKEIMMSVDLDEVTSKYIRSRLEEQLDMDLREFKSFIDQEMLVILGQMDAATEIFPHVYLGSEWNASNLEELNKNGICHILNVTREIDNFFPGTFDYHNIRVYDDDNTDLLKHWDNTYKYINKVKKENSKVLVHCKMGISRSASVVIAYAMKAYSWDFKKAFDYVRKKRSCIKPNQNFLNQLETYQGMLDAMKNKEKLQRSKSETNLKSSATKTRFHGHHKKKREETSSVGDEPHKIEDEKTNQVLHAYPMLRVNSGVELAQLSLRPKSWSPDNLIASEIFSSTGTMSQSLEQLNSCKLSTDSHSSSASSLSTSPPRIPPAPPLPPLDSRYNLNVRMPCENGLTYSVSQNKIMQLYPAQNQNQSADTEETGMQKSNVSETHKLDTVLSPSNPFMLQMPSQFQGKLLSFSRRENASSLVMKETQNTRSSSSLTTTVYSEQESHLALTKECVVASVPTLPKSRISTVLCYQKEETSIQFDGNIPPTLVVERSSDSTNTLNNNDQPIKTPSANVTAAGPSLNVSSTVQFLERMTLCRTNRTYAGEKEDKTKGLVQNLKKEFEAKCNVFDRGKQRKRSSFHGDVNDLNTINNNDMRSPPSSPINDKQSGRSKQRGGEDLSVRKLVGKYEVAKCNNKQGTKSDEKRQPPIPPRKSSLDVVHTGSGKSTSKLLGPSSGGGFSTQYSRGYRGVAPIVKSFLNKPNEIKTTVTKAANILQQSKPYPLSKLAFCKQRNNTSVYNTV